MEYSDGFYKERDEVRKELIDYLYSNPVHIKKMSKEIGLSYAHVQKWIRDPEYIMGRIGMIRIKNFLKQQKGS